jgi:hypothetical protein
VRIYGSHPCVFILGHKSADSRFGDVWQGVGPTGRHDVHAIPSPKDEEAVQYRQQESEQDLRLFVARWGVVEELAAL